MNKVTVSKAGCVVLSVLFSTIVYTSSLCMSWNLC